MAFKFCFICLNKLTPPEGEGVEGVLKLKLNKKGRISQEEIISRGRRSASVKYLIKYLLQTKHIGGKSYDSDGVLNDILDNFIGGGGDSEAGHGSGPGTGGPLRKRARRSKSALQLQLCPRCESVAGRILELHLELEKLQMVIVNEIKTVRETIMRSSGWLGGSRGGKLEEGEDHVLEDEAFEHFSRKFFDSGGCGGSSSSLSKEKRIFELLKTFQGAVAETGKGSVHVPLVYLQNYGPSQKIYRDLWKGASFNSGSGATHPVFKTEPPCPKSEEADPFLELEGSILPDYHDESNYDHDMASSPLDAMLLSEDIKAPLGDSDSEEWLPPPPSPSVKPEGKPRKGVVKSKSKSTLTKVRKKKASSTSTTPFNPASNFKLPILRRIARHYVCELCSFRSRTTCRFEQHLREHETETKTFQCDKPGCSSSGFTNQQYYSLHQDRHSGAHNSRCDVCKELLNSFELQEHMKTHSETVVPCSNCCQWLPNMERLMAHIRKHHFGKDMKCEVCEKRFPTQVGLVRHLHDVHKLVAKTKCDFEGCGKTFLNPHSLYLHRNLHTDQFTCKVCFKRFTSQYILDAHGHLHGAERKEKKFKCDQCPESFDYKETFQTHMIRDHGATKFKCQICAKEFASAGGLQQHDILEHGPATPCPICNLKCVNEYRLKRHMQSHSDTKNYVCDECGKSFHTISGYKSHIPIHGEKKFQCSYCPKGFTKRAYLTEHTRTHTGEKPFACEGCGKAFSQRGPLKNHLRSCHLSSPSTSNRTGNLSSDPGQADPLASILSSM